MAENLYNKKLSDLQKHIPFMENMIAQLKDPKWKPREAQLNKMESLYNMITDRNKKWKYETLLKCEEVIMKLQSKVKANRPIFSTDKKEQFMNPERPDAVTNTVSDIMNALKLSNARAKLNCEMSTPKSPSPIRDSAPQHAPKIIPFEATNEPIRKSTNIVDPNELSVTWNTETQDRYVNEKPDIYASAAKSLGVVPPVTAGAVNPNLNPIPGKVSIFDRLGPVVLEASEKPLLSDADLEMLRTGDDFVVICQNDRPSKGGGINKSKSDKSLTEINLKVTPRIAPVPASKPKGSPGETTSKDEKPKHSKKSEAACKEEDKSKKSKEAKSPKGEKIITSDIFGNCLSSIDNIILEDSKKKDKKKDERRHSGEHKREKHHHESKHQHKHKSKEKEAQIKEEQRMKDPRLAKLENRAKIMKEAAAAMMDKTIDTKEKVSDEKVSSLFPPPSIEISGEKPKRLADKYNPKPRKHAEFEEKIIPVNEVAPSLESRDPRRRPPPPPSSSTAPYQRLPMPPLPPLPPMVPPVNPHMNVLNTLGPFLGVQQPPAISPPQIPLLPIGLQMPQDCQSWMGESHQSPFFEPPQHRQRQGFHQDNPEGRINNDPRRQPRFSPPPAASPQFGGNNFASGMYGQPRPELNFVPPMQRSIFDSSRFEPPPPPASPRFETTIPNGHAPQAMSSRKSFCPFEPLRSDKEKEEMMRGNQYYGYQQRDHYGGGGGGRGDNHNFRGNFNRFDRNFDRYGRRNSRDDAKLPPHRSDRFKPVSKEDENNEDNRLKSGGESDSKVKELSHTKYDEIYSKLDAEKETFSSPLESLYSNAKTAVKSSFKIPKKPKPEPPPPPPAAAVVEAAEEPKVIEVTDTEKEIDPAKDEVGVVEIEDSEEKIETTTRSNVISSDSEEDVDDVPIWKRVKRRAKMASKKKKIIADSDDESETHERPEDEGEELKEDTPSLRPKRSTRQSAIKANKLIAKKSAVKPPKRRCAQRAKAKQEEIVAETIEEESPSIEEVEVQAEAEVSTETEVKVEEKPAMKEEEIVVKDDDDGPKEPEEVKKAKEELLCEAKKKNLNLNDQGTEVLQFILMNYKKIKKIFKNDSSSDEEERDKKKKRRKRDRSSSSSSSSSDNGRDKRRHREKSHEDEKDEKERKKKKVKRGSDDDDVEEADDKLEVIPPKPQEEEEVEEEGENIEAPPEMEVEQPEAIEEEEEEEVVPSPKPPVKKLKRMATRKRKFVRKKLKGMMTRNQALHSPTKKARRSELDKLHDDIKEMLMGNEVLTSTGKRACTMPKEDEKIEEGGDEVAPLDRNPTPIPTTRGAHLRVLIEKTDIEKLLTKEVAAEENEEVTPTPVVAPPPEEEEPNFETLVAPKLKVKKKFLRRKKYRWASGIIRRKNKRKVSEGDEGKSAKLEEGEDPLAPLHDKNYYVDGSKSRCKLCPFKGKLIIQHYRSAHPDSEVIISRMDPATTEHLMREAKDRGYDAIESGAAGTGAEEAIPNFKKKRYGFKCPFKCLIGTTIDTFESYYDHVTCHTGEHRYYCPGCIFTTYNPRNLRAHMLPQHNMNLDGHGKPVVAAPPPSKYIFGYVCATCHYVQTRKSRLDAHIENYHENRGEIVKINLSLICQEQEELEGLPGFVDNVRPSPATKKHEHVNECIESVVNGAGSIRTPEPAQVKDFNIFELMSQIEAETEPETEDLPPILVKMEPLDDELDLDALIPDCHLDESAIVADKPNNPDLTVFMCHSDLPVDDEETIERRRLKKMNEIHENCRPARTSIVDKLQSRLETNAQEDRRGAASRTEVVDPLSPTPPPTVFSKPPPLVPLDRPKKSLDSIPKNLVVTAEVGLAPKNVAPISSIINRLQDKLLPGPSGSNKQIYSPDSTSSTSSSDRSNTPSTLNIGPIAVTYGKNNEILYSCFIPSCVFNTLNANIFERHCRTTHRQFVYHQNKCDACNVKIDHDDPYITMHDIYRHICTSHSDFLDVASRKTSNNNNGPEDNAAVVDRNVDERTGQDPPVSTAYPFRMAKVTSLDLETAPLSFVTPEAASSENQSKNPTHEVQKSITFTLPHEVPNLISSQASNDPGPKFPFVITSVTSLAKKVNSYKSLTLSLPSQTTQTAPVPSFQSAPTNINSALPAAPIPAAVAIPSTSALVPIILNPAATSKEIVKLQLPIISSIQSLAPPRKDLIRPVPLTQLTSTETAMPSATVTVESSLVDGDSSKITLNDYMVSKEEKEGPRKSPTVLTAMLDPDSIGRFYKCPQYFCSFACDKPQDLAAHLTNYDELMFAHCLYCNRLMQLKMYLKHLEVRHSNCEYACGRCFYRTTNAAFVQAHNNMKHAFDEPIIIKTPRENMPVRISMQKAVPIRLILKPYICGQPGCTMKTIFLDVFLDHLNAYKMYVKKICAICRAEMKNVTSHWASHGVHPYHCRYCTLGSKNIDLVVNHQALRHSKMDYCIINRKFVPNPNFPERTGLSYGIKENATYERLYILYGGEALKQTSKSAPVQILDKSPPRADSIFFQVDPAGRSLETDSPLPLLDDNQTDVTADEPEIPILSSDFGDASVDPLSFDSNAVGNLSDGFDSNNEKEGDVDVPHYDGKTATSKYDEEYSGADLYVCICSASFEEKSKFKSHIVDCQGGKSFGCVHCGIKKKSVGSLMIHLNEHGRKRFKCSLCQYKHVSQKYVRDHMNVQHNVHDVMVLPATVTKKVDYRQDDFVLRPKLSFIKRIGAIAAPVEPPAAAKTVFTPAEIDSLPRPPIYQTDVFCSICNYATKVKSNIVRHLQAHQNEKAVSETAPVNPVPCLEKSEKMFDKMVNLAMSSHSGSKTGTAKGETAEEIHVPAFVPINKRYVCGADTCNYLCPEEGMLRRHLTTFHSQELNYICLHCNAKIYDDKLINVDGILKHLKLHDNHLYGCSLCKFIHNLRHKVERHMTDKHADKSPSFVTFREIGKEADTETTTATPTEKREEPKKPWRCGMCKFRCTNMDEVKIHVQVKHDVTAKQRCALCEFGSEDVASFARHFDANHSGSNVDMIITYYKEDEPKQRVPEPESEFNTTPLWQRNKSIKHIRGILLEDGNNKMPKVTGAKKTKGWKSRKGEAQSAEPKSHFSLDSNPAMDPGRKLTSSETSTTAETKKPQPKRRRSRVNSKMAAKTDDPKIPESPPKKVGGDTIFMCDVDEEEESQMIDVITLDDLKLKDPLKLNKNKTATTTTGDKSKHLKSKGKIMEVMVEMSKSSDVIEISDEKPERVKVAGNARNDVIEISDEKPETDPFSDRKLDIVFETADKTGNAKTKSATMATLRILDPPSCQINLDDSSTEDSDVVEIANDGTPPEEAESGKEAESPVEDDSTSVSDCIKNIKVVNVCSLKEDVEETPPSNIKDIKVISVRSLKEAAGETNVKDIKVTNVRSLRTESPPTNVKNIKVVNVCSLKDAAGETPPTNVSDIKVVSVCSLKDTAPPLDSPETTPSDEDTGEEEVPFKSYKSDISIREIESMSKDDLLLGNFVGTYGPYGFPWSGNYKCPLCEKYLSTSSTMFKSHLYEELQYGTYKCKACDFTDFAKSVVECHHRTTHAHLVDTEDDLVVSVSDQQIVDWVDKVIVCQSRILTLAKEESFDSHFYCQFCDYKCPAQSDLRKHQTRHWTVHPFTCSVCKYKAINKSTIDRHIVRSHPKMDVHIKEAEVSDAVVIKRIGRYTSRAEAVNVRSETYETCEMDGEGAAFNAADLDDEAPMSCAYCDFREILPELRKHLAEVHPEECRFRCYRYWCNYCASTFVLSRTLNQHFISCHSGMKHNYSEVSDVRKQYSCPKCPMSEDTMQKISDHLRSHFKMLECSYCDLKAVYWKTLQKHYLEEHDDKNFDFTYLLSEERRYEEALALVDVACIAPTPVWRKRKRVEEGGRSLRENAPVVEASENKTKVKIKQVARKSTGGGVGGGGDFGGGISGYKKVIEPTQKEDYSNIITTIDVMGIPVTMNVMKLSKLLNISPVVALEDCQTGL